MKSESAEQTEFMTWASRYDIPEGKLGHFFFAVPNEGKRDRRFAAHLKGQGMKPGVPDLVLALPRGGFHGLFIEMKTKENGVVSESQQKWLDRLRSVGYDARVAHGCEEAIEIAVNYLSAFPTLKHIDGPDIGLIEEVEKIAEGKQP